MCLQHDITNWIDKGRPTISGRPVIFDGKPFSFADFFRTNRIDPKFDPRYKMYYCNQRHTVACTCVWAESSLSEYADALENPMHAGKRCFIDVLLHSQYAVRSVGEVIGITREIFNNCEILILVSPTIFRRAWTVLEVACAIKNGCKIHGVGQYSVPADARDYFDHLVAGIESDVHLIRNEIVRMFGNSRAFNIAIREIEEKIAPPAIPSHPAIQVSVQRVPAVFPLFSIHSLLTCEAYLMCVTNHIRSVPAHSSLPNDVHFRARGPVRVYLSIYLSIYTSIHTYQSVMHTCVCIGWVATAATGPACFGDLRVALAQKSAHSAQQHPRRDAAGPCAGAQRRVHLGGPQETPYSAGARGLSSREAHPPLQRQDPPGVVAPHPTLTSLPLPLLLIPPQPTPLYVFRLLPCRARESRRDAGRERAKNWERDTLKESGKRVA